MSVITIAGAGMMGSAIGIPAAENGNEVRLVGTPLDREIITHAEKTGEHLTLKRKLPSSYKYYQIEGLKAALENADLLVGGVSSFGLEWFEKKILAVIPESLPVLSVTKGIQDTEDGGLISYPAWYAARLKNKRLSLNAVGGPCTSYELADRDQTEVCFCGEDINTLRKIKGMFENSNKQIRTILAILNSAKEGKLRAQEKHTKIVKDSYQYILYNIINTFIEKDYLTMQLSERKYKDRLDELIALQSQINPHFLFNTLQTINMKAIGLGGTVQNEVTYMIEHLSSMLRYSLADPTELIRLEEEISNVKSYLAIQSIRYKNLIRVRWEYNESVLNLGAIKLLIQPLVENSIYHGIKEQENPGEILIVIEEEQDILNITVADTGIGIPVDILKNIQEQLNKSNDQFEHIGLYNTNRRIKLRFGESYGIMIESEAGFGTIVRINLPKILL